MKKRVVISLLMLVCLLSFSLTVFAEINYQLYYDMDKILLYPEDRYIDITVDNYSQESGNFKLEIYDQNTQELLYVVTDNIGASGSSSARKTYSWRVGHNNQVNLYVKMYRDSESILPIFMLQ
ncbi:hypothetical protein [Wukongibacter sp. M2B1]|uniref:hypothetical protein n=1 Tax=Wukongibacter sp. M2B1 TaxID=3088895 RepID=UPI003D7BA481